MTSSLRKAMYLGLFLGMLPYSLRAANVPLDWSIGDIVVGESTLADVEKIYGVLTMSRVSSEDEADLKGCYQNGIVPNVTFLEFETGPMGGFKQITGFTISMFHPKEKCTETKIAIGAQKISFGLSLGESHSDFRKRLSVPFKRIGPELVYEGIVRGTAQNKKPSSQGEQPSEQVEGFDITVNLKAKFAHNALKELSVQKIESN